LERVFPDLQNLLFHSKYQNVKCQFATQTHKKSVAIANFFADIEKFGKQPQPTNKNQHLALLGTVHTSGGCVTPRSGEVDNRACLWL